MASSRPTMMCMGDAAELLVPVHSDYDSLAGAG
jgi:hypothetical protein